MLALESTDSLRESSRAAAGAWPIELFFLTSAGFFASSFGPEKLPKIDLLRDIFFDWYDYLLRVELNGNWNVTVLIFFRHAEGV